ncbi:MAG: NUDIX domain-containing protein [Anaerolineae bacterium]|jgi:isopentenyldiphosphate isomerase
MVDEKLDVVNEDNEVVGQERRSIIHSSGLWHRGVHVLLFTPDRRLLVQRRSRAHEAFPGAWDCSISEHLRIGESYLDGAIRGLREELSLGPIPLTHLLRLKMNYGPNDNMINDLYEGTCRDKSPIPAPDEIERIAFHTVPEIKRMIRSRQSSFTPWFVQLLRWYTRQPADMQVLWKCHERPTGMR